MMLLLVLGFFPLEETCAGRKGEDPHRILPERTIPLIPVCTFPVPKLQIVVEQEKKVVTITTTIVPTIIIKIVVAITIATTTTIPGILTTTVVEAEVALPVASN